MEERVLDQVSAKEEVSQDVLDLWSDVIQLVNVVLTANRQFGFLRLEEKLNPSLEELILAVEVVDSILSSMERSRALEHDDLRKVYNARQCALNLKRLASALKDRDHDEYAKIMKDLDNQAQF